jgi:SCP-2 sterol transfer family protein
MLRSSSSDEKEAEVPHTFLSDGWLEEVQKLAAESGGGGMMPDSVVLNMVVTGGPEGDRELHVAGGKFGAGLVEAPTKLTVPFDVAKNMFVNGDQQAAMQAFMQGQIKVEGDMSKLMAMQGQGGGDPAAAAAMQAKLKEITAD